MEDLAAAGVDADVGYGTVHARFLEEDQVSGTEVGLLPGRPTYHCPTGLSGIVTHLLKTRLVKQEQSSER